MRFLGKVGVVLAWILAALLAALLVTFLVAFVIDPHGTGPVGEGLVFLAVFVATLGAGAVFGLIRIDNYVRKRHKSLE